MVDDKYIISLDDMRILSNFGYSIHVVIELSCLNEYQRFDGYAMLGSSFKETVIHKKILHRYFIRLLEIYKSGKTFEEVIKILREINKSYYTKTITRETVNIAHAPIIAIEDIRTTYDYFKVIYDAFHKDTFKCPSIQEVTSEYIAYKDNEGVTQYMYAAKALNTLYREVMEEVCDSLNYEEYLDAVNSVYKKQDLIEFTSDNNYYTQIWDSIYILTSQCPRSLLDFTEFDYLTGDYSISCDAGRFYIEFNDSCNNTILKMGIEDKRGMLEHLCSIDFDLIPFYDEVLLSDTMARVGGTLRGRPYDVIDISDCKVFKRGQLKNGTEVLLHTDDGVIHIDYSDFNLISLSESISGVYTEGIRFDLQSDTVIEGVSKGTRGHNHMSLHTLTNILDIRPLCFHSYIDLGTHVEINILCILTINDGRSVYAKIPLQLVYSIRFNKYLGFVLETAFDTIEIPLGIMKKLKCSNDINTYIDFEGVCSRINRTRVLDRVIGKTFASSDTFTTR